MGSVIEGEDVVQDTLIRALVGLQAGEPPANLRSWLFRIAHNRALDLLRSRTARRAETLETAADLADPAEDPLEMMIRREVTETAVARFLTLPVQQRSAVILKDVLGEPLADIAALLDLTVDAVKAHLARGRARLGEINAEAGQPTSPKPVSLALMRYAELFTQRDWPALRTLLADDVRLVQSSRPPREGSSEVSLFFTIYAGIERIRLAPAWLEGREVAAVFEGADALHPAYVMWVEWRDGQISFIRDYRYSRYVFADADLTLVPAPA
jgi:RNA polymerase sigma-70 factor (ECF subfamily)